jgi:hypothetical protein
MYLAIRLVSDNKDQVNLLPISVCVESSSALISVTWTVRTITAAELYDNGSLMLMSPFRGSILKALAKL